jgi:hypothetical protein
VLSATLLASTGHDSSCYARSGSLFGCRFGFDSFVFWTLRFHNAAMRVSVDAQLKDIWSRIVPGNITVPLGREDILY